MNQIPIYLACATLLCACSQEAQIPETPSKAELPPVAINAEVEISRAKSAIGIFAAALQTELKKAMQEGGPTRAISVCNTEAIPITQSVASEQGLELSRVSLRNRNPANAPNDWQKPVLESFERRKAAGEDPATLSWFEVAEVKGQHQFRFMKAIPTAPLCLQCHGSAIAPEISARLDELYPQDKATGFEAGDIRGAFVVIQ
jgi:hypothetical protein